MVLFIDEAAIKNHKIITLEMGATFFHFTSQDECNYVIGKTH